MISGIVAGLLSVVSLGALQDTTGTVHGRILSAETGDPIAGASVRVHHGTTFRLLITDESGAYRAERLIAGDAVIVAQALGHAPLEAVVRIPAGADVALDLELQLRPLVLPVLFTKIEAARLRLPPPGMVRGGLREEGETELRALDSTPGVAELGLTGSGSDPSDPASVLYVRGAAADLKLVLLDGAPVYAPFHLSGLLDAFPDGVLQDAQLYIGGTPARFDGGLSYVLDLEIREGNKERFRTSGAIDLLGASGRVEGPIGSDARVLLSGRTLHGAGYELLTGDSDLPYGYGDILGRFDTRLGSGRFAATGFWNRESVQLNIGKLEGAAPESAYWGNTAGSARYRIGLGDGELRVMSAYGRFSNRIPALDEDAEGSVGFSTARGQISRSRNEVYYSFGEDVRWVVGGAFDTQETVLDQRSVFGDTTAHTVVRANVGAVWGEAAWDVAPKVELRIGARASYFQPEGGPRLAPRVSAIWHVDDNARLSIAAGRFFQVVRGPETILSSDLTGPTVGAGQRPTLDAPGPLLGSQLGTVAGATHLVVGLENRLSNGIDVGLEGYFKSFDGLPAAENLFSSGADLWLQQEEGAVRGWLGYSLAWVWTSESSADAQFVGRQLLSGGLRTAARGFDIGLRLTYGAGLPFTNVSSGSAFTGTPSGGVDDTPSLALSGAPDDSYLRLDAEISKRWMGKLGDSRFELAPYVRVLNGLDRRDALFFRAAEDGPARPAQLASVPILAVFGIAWSF